MIPICFGCYISKNYIKENKKICKCKIYKSAKYVDKKDNFAIERHLYLFDNHQYSESIGS